jgi:hypothetical protein
MKYYLLLIAAVLSTLLVSCETKKRTSTADENLAAKTEASMQEANRQVGMPAIKNFQERKLMKMILELRDQENLVCYAYIIDLNGIKHFLGKCIGYGLPYSVQYTNPEKIWGGRGSSQGGYYGGTIPQPDPNGLYMPSGLAATWLMLIDPTTGEPHPVYVEPEIMVSPFKLH